MWHGPLSSPPATDRQPKLVTQDKQATSAAPTVDLQEAIIACGYHLRHIVSYCIRQHTIEALLVSATHGKGMGRCGLSQA